MDVDVSNSLRLALDEIVAFLPNLLAFLVILLIGYIVAKLVQAALRKVLQRSNIDRHVHDSSAARYVEGMLPGATPSRGIARIAFWLVFGFFAFAALGVLGIQPVTDVMNAVLGYLPNIVVAIIIFVAAVILSNAVGTMAARMTEGSTMGRIASAVAPALIWVLAVFMILQQLKIAPEIVEIAFAAIMFALALGLALAFGLGGRPVAQRMLEDGYRRGQEEAERIRVLRLEDTSGTTTVAEPTANTLQPLGRMNDQSETDSAYRHDPSGTDSTYRR